ncbi:hypothetical protein CAPTEDRAFT_176253 [Capitella teleta]|uniref:T-cell immunomodulatory protein TIP C2 domain-containing protein n=2 Tax=Capitella teleta TaxID=283909 RepID=R7TSJ8_CAPTE|nr:hypothetical protein CAPTEDRAFT_176253 [Capitella teleta]|eukprot:ELT96853.1 hypothetical protein CAPTEDRAFT_176253 [Capitella teleta]
MVDVYFGNKTTLTVGKKGFHINETFSDHPLLCDYNADQLPDLLAETQPGKRYVWLATKDNSFVKTNFATTSSNLEPFKIPASHAYVDINKDLNADIVISGEFYYEEWLNINGYFMNNSLYDLPADVEYIGQSSFGDFNQDGTIDHIIPVCRKLTDNKCTESEIHVHTDNQWKVLKSDFSVEEANWQFVVPGSGPLASHTNYSEPVTLVVGDFNIDGYPDILVVLTAELKDPEDPKKTKSQQRAFLMTNVACIEAPCKEFGRTFDVEIKEPFNQIDNILMAAFFDVYEDGILDVVMVFLTEDYQPRLFFLKNVLSEDAYFLKVLVVSGLCGDSCDEPYGVNIVGPAAFYQTTKMDGSDQISQATQLMQSAHFPLQLPYTVFGLGPTSNFLDKIAIGIPRTPGTTATVSRSWPEIIPNSQIFIIPDPLNNPDKWIAKLYVTPSHLVYLTGFALLGTCGFMAIIVGVLHWREKREDLLEKKQEAQKFHFDAM